MFRLLHALCLVLFTAVSLAAQTFAGLVADSVTYDADTRELLAKGNVVVGQIRDKLLQPVSVIGNIRIVLAIIRSDIAVDFSDIAAD